MYTNNTARHTLITQNERERSEREMFFWSIPVVIVVHYYFYLFFGTIISLHTYDTKTNNNHNTEPHEYTTEKKKFGTRTYQFHRNGEKTHGPSPKCKRTHKHITELTTPRDSSRIQIMTPRTDPDFASVCPTGQDVPEITDPRGARRLVETSSGTEVKSHVECVTIWHPHLFNSNTCNSSPASYARVTSGV